MQDGDGHVLQNGNTRVFSIWSAIPPTIVLETRDDGGNLLFHYLLFFYMKHAYKGFVAVTVMALSFVVSVPVFAQEVPAGGGEVPTSCEEQNANLDRQIANKAVVHASLNARHDALEVRVNALIAKAQEKQVSTTQLEAAFAQMTLLSEAVNVAYDDMHAAWLTYQGRACEMSAEEWLAGVSYTNELAQTFEAAGDAVSHYLQSVLNPIIQQVTKQVLTTR